MLIKIGICVGVLDYSLSLILLNGDCETVCFRSFYEETYEELLSPGTPALFLRKSYINNGIRFTKYLSIPIPTAHQRVLCLQCFSVMISVV